MNVRQSEIDPEAKGATRRRFGRRRFDDDGAALVEAAILMPLLLLIVFGILEFGLAYRAALSISESTRAGARVAVAQPRVLGYEATGSAAVSGALVASGIPADDIEELIIYKADPTTGRLAGGGEPRNCVSNCWRFVWDAGSSTFVLAGGSPTWPAASQSACGSETQTDYLGVYVRARYDFITGFFGESMTMSERSVMRLEPLPLTDTCAP